MLTLLANLTLNLLLVRPLGIEGIAVATTASFTLGAVLHWWDFTRRVPVELPVRELGWCVASTVVMTTLLAGLSEVLLVGSVTVLAALVAAGVAIYLLSIAAYSPLRNRLLDDLRRIVA